MTFEVQLQVAGAVSAEWIAGALPLFEVEPAFPVTTIRGVLAPGEDLLSIIVLLRRHGLTPLDVWVDEGSTDRT